MTEGAICNLWEARDARGMLRKRVTDFPQCRRCGIKWVHPLPEMEELRELFALVTGCRISRLARS